MTRPTTRHECDRDCGRAPGSCSDCPYVIKHPLPIERLGRDFERVLYDNLWDLYVRS